MKPKTRIQQIVEDNPIYQRLDARNEQPGRLTAVKTRQPYRPGQPTPGATITDTLFSYAFGFAGMLLLAMAIAASFNYRILFGLQQSSFEALPTGLAISLLYPLILIIFVFIAYVSKTWMFAAYPVAMLALTGLFADNSFIYWLAGWLPFADVSNNGMPVFSLYAFVAVTLMIMLIYCVEKPIRALSSRALPRNELLLHKTWLVAVLCAVALAGVVGRPLHQQVLQSRAAVSLPNTSSLSAFNPTEKNFRLAYPIPKSVDEINYDELKVTPVQDWWRRSTQAVCGESASYGPNSPVLDNIYRSAEGNTTYATAINGNTEYACFVIGYQRFDIKRDTTSYRYAHNTTASVVDAFAVAPRYVLFCDETQALPRPSRDQRRIAADACTARHVADYSRAQYNRTIEAK